ncbi:PBIP1 protein, partial [Rhynochetos jubatus]|nr:PBIP1 protein [Rhynochetos jubatus]
DPEERWEPGAGTTPAPARSEEPDALDDGEQEEPDAEAEPGPHPDTPKAGPPMEEGSCTSSEDDVEGLRRREGHEPRSGPAAPVASTTRWMVSTGDCPARAGRSTATAQTQSRGRISPSGSSAGPVESVVSRDVAAGEQESPLPADSSDLEQKPPAPGAGDPQSVQSLSLLLDKLAKENQEIRLMQAELQAHKEELQALLRKSEGEAAAAGTQRQSLAAENARL